MKKLVFFLLCMGPIGFNSFCQNYFDLYNKAIQPKGFNFLLRTDHFIRESGYCYIISNNEYYKSFPSPFDTMNYKSSFLYYFEYNLRYGEIVNVRKMLSRKISTNEQDTILHYVNELFKISTISMNDYIQDTIKPPFKYNEGYSSEVVIDYCTIGNKYLVDYKNSDPKLQVNQRLTKLIMYLNSYKYQ